MLKPRFSHVQPGDYFKYMSEKTPKKYHFLKNNVAYTLGLKCYNQNRLIKRSSVPVHCSQAS